MAKDLKKETTTNNKLKKVKKSGQKKVPKEKIINPNKVKKHRDGKKREKKKIVAEQSEPDDNNEEYQLTSNDMDELKKPENKKNVISKRQLKREAYEKLQQEQRLLSSNILQEKAWDYLETWKNNKSEWKFQKVRQGWLIDNLFDTDKIPDHLWEISLEYFSASQGGVRNTIIAKSTKIVEEMSNWIEKYESANDKSENDPAKPCEIKYGRARQILQCLQE